MSVQSGGEVVPVVSVLIPVHNAEKYLREALASIEAQTYRDFEVVAVDDGSTDASADLLDKASGCYPWLRVLRRPERGGVAAALNTGLAECRGEFIARMDADDVSLPNRLSCQVEFLRTNKDIALCGSAVRVFGWKKSEVMRPPVGDDKIRAWLVFGSAFVHPSVMFRHSLITTVGAYASVVGVEDYDLWLRMVRTVRCSNLTDVLLRYRVHAEQYTSGKSAAHYLALNKVRLDWLRSLSIDFSEEEALAHDLLAFDRPDLNGPPLQVIAQWLRRLRTEVAAANWCSADAIRKMCGDRWWAAARRRSRGARAALAYLNGPVAGYGLRELGRAFRLLLIREGR